MVKYLLKYLSDNSKSEQERKFIDYFKIELDWFIYNYGDHISKTHNRTNSSTLRSSLIRYIQYYSVLTKKVSENKKNRTNVLSSIPIQKEVLNDLGFNVFSSIFQPTGLSNIVGEKKTILLKKEIDKILRSGEFNELCSTNLFEKVQEALDSLKNQILEINCKAFFAHTGQYYSSKILLDIFKDINRPSFIFSHGLPGIYSPHVDDNSDYLMVWGEKIKANYVNNGFDSSKIKVVGNTKYANIEVNFNLRNSLEDILVIPCSSVLWHQHEWSDPILIDRSLVILYLYQVQKVLQELGIKKARFRPHPAIDTKWVQGFIDNEFYVPDNLALSKSLTQSTLVIGAPSTTFLEAVIYGVNYLVYNPFLLGSKSYPPFDGSEDGIYIAKTESDLKYLVKNKFLLNSKILNDYIQPLDLSILKSLVK